MSEKEVKHMPGPWSVNESVEHCGARIDGPNGRSVAHAIQRDPHPALGQGITQAEAQANARLIAAAPDLLDCVTGFRRKLETYLHVYTGDKELRELLAKCDEALARATS